MDISQLRGMLDQKKISVKEVLTECLRKENYNSFITINHDADTENAQKMIDRGEAKPLTGIPVAVKDNISTKGIRTTCASKMLENYIPAYDATAVERIKAEGGIIFAKTNMDEFAMGNTGETSYFGKTLNPYDKNKLPGGSSSGSAVCVASGVVPASLGSDTGGSVRQPSAFCGVTGLKPTYGSVSRYGLIAFASSLDQIGIIANSARDTEIVLEAIAGYDRRDSTSAKFRYTSQTGKDLSGMTVGVLKEFSDMSPEVEKAVFSAIDYYKSIGCRIKEVSMPSLAFALPAYYLISSAEAASNLARYDGIKYGYRSQNGNSYDELIKNTRREGFGEEVKRRIMLGNYALSAGYHDEYYKKATMIRERIISEYNAVFEECDVILAPTTPETAPAIGIKDKNPSELYVADIFTVSVNLAGLPAINTTCGYDFSGMPIGMSIIGRAFSETDIIAVADRFERDFERRIL